jgi:peptide/nickel transport system ATP-binding protein
VHNLKMHFPIRRGVFARTVSQVRAVDGVSIHIGHGETLGHIGGGCR